MTDYSTSMFSLKTLRAERKMPEVIAVTSAKSGVGKTFYSVNLSILLQQFKKKVLLIDVDLHAGNIDRFLGFKARYMITEGITQNLDFKNSIYKGPGNIDILPVNSALRETTNRKDGQLLKKITPAFSKYEHEYDKVIVDAGTGISGDVLSFVLGADRVILLTTSDPTSIADVYGMIKIISRHDEKKPIFLVLNMINGDVDGRTLYNKMKLMVQKFLNIEINFGGIVHNDVVAARLVQDRHMTILDYPNTIAAEELNISVRQMINTPSVNVPKANGYFNRVISNRNNLSIS